jgi:hypothetical protein
MESIARSSEQYAEAKKRKSTMQEKRRENLEAKSRSLGVHRMEDKLWHEIEPSTSKKAELVHFAECLERAILYVIQT